MSTASIIKESIKLSIWNTVLSRISRDAYVRFCARFVENVKNPALDSTDLHS